MELGSILAGIRHREKGLEEIRIATDPSFGACLAAEPALFLKEMQEDETTQQGLDEVTDGFVCLFLFRRIG